MQYNTTKISSLRQIRETLIINPFVIYFILSKEDLNKKSVLIKEIWNNFILIPNIYELKFLYKEDLIQKNEIEEDDNHGLQYKIENKNIFARVLEFSTTTINIECGNINIDEDEIESLEADILFFVLQVCKTNLYTIRRIRFSSNSDAPENSNQNIHWVFLKDLELVFENIENYIQHKFKENIIYKKLRQPSSYPKFEQIRDYIILSRSSTLDNVINKSKEKLSVQDKATFIGFHVPVINPEEDSKIKIEIIEQASISKFPGIKITKGDKIATMKKGYKEGMFQYLFSILNHILYENKPDISQDKLYSKEEFDELLEEYTRFFDSKEKRLPHDLMKKVEKYKSLYIALYYIGENNLFDLDKNFSGRENFESWCDKLQKRKFLNKRFHEGKIPSKDPFYQGISNIRDGIKKSLKEAGLSSIHDKVDMTRNLEKIKKGDYHTCIEKENIIFPQNKKWDNIKELLKRSIKDI